MNSRESLIGGCRPLVGMPGFPRAVIKQVQFSGIGSLRAVVTWFVTLLMTISGTVAVAGTLLATRTMEICSNASAVDHAIEVKLTGIGWHTLSEGDGQRFKSLFVDGVAAATGGSPMQTVHWKPALRQAEQVAGLLLKQRGKMPELMLFLSAPKDSALALVTVQSTPKVFRCLYSGVTDESMTSLIDTILDMDKRTGKPQLTKGIKIVRVQEMGAGMLTDIQVARLLPEVKNEIGHSPSVQLGFSLYRVPAR